jgi:hypothetical protein
MQISLHKTRNLIASVGHDGQCVVYDLDKGMVKAKTTGNFSGVEWYRETGFATFHANRVSTWGSGSAITLKEVVECHGNIL